MNGPDWTAKFEAPDGRPILHAYPDPLTGGAPWTIGLGHTGADVGPKTVWTEDQCIHAFHNDYQVASIVAATVIGSLAWAGLNEPRRAVLADMAFNIGQSRLSGFAKMLGAIRRKDWTEAKAQMLDSAYARQVKTRAKRNAKTLLTGEWAYDAD